MSKKGKNMIISEEKIDGNLFDEDNEEDTNELKKIQRLLSQSKENISESEDNNNDLNKKTGNKIVNEFYFLDTIGRGAYSKVKKCINLNTREEFAVKIINKKLLRKKKKSYGKTKEGTLKMKIRYLKII